MPSPVPEGNDVEAQQGSDTAICWACRAVVIVPNLESGFPAPIYKCGWCGALNPRDLSRPQREDRLTQRPSNVCGSLIKRFGKSIDDACALPCATGLLNILGSLIIVFVCLLVGAIGVFGTYPVLWYLFGNGFLFWSNVAITFFLEFNIMFNYFLAVTRSAGKVEDFYNLEPSQHGFPNHSYCNRCESHKPPGTHHCKVCGRCVVDMDHHCPFLNNCVGRGNMRYFLLFLFWVTAAMLYALPMLGFAIHHQRSHAWKAWDRLKSRQRHRHGSRSTGFQDVFLLLDLFVDLPASMCVALYLGVLCLVVLLMVGTLCVRHWWLTAEGSTYVGQLQGEHLSRGRTLQNLQYVFGESHPIYWLLPSFSDGGRHQTLKSSKEA